MLTTKLYFPSMASFHTHTHTQTRAHTHTLRHAHTHTHSLSLRCARAHMRMRTHSHIRWFPFISPHLDHIWLRAKRCANGGSDFWLSIKSVSNTLSCCCFVCAFIIGQCHSGNNMSSKSGAAGEILFFESENCHRIRPLKTDTLKVSAFDAFIHVHEESKHYLCHRFAQRRYHFTLIITKFCFWS